MIAETLEILLALQEVDSARDHNAEATAALDNGDAQRALVDELRAKAEATSKAHYDAEKEALDAELEVKSVEEKRELFSDKLRSGRIRNPKELSDIEAEVNALTRQADMLQDKTLSLIDAVEQAKAAMETARHDLQNAKAKLALLAATYERESERLGREREDLEGKRALLVTQVPADLLKRYDQVRKGKGGLAVVRVTGDNCPGCSVTIPKDLMRTLSKAAGITTCDSCGRIFVAPVKAVADSMV